MKKRAKTRYIQFKKIFDENVDAKKVSNIFNKKKYRYENGHFFGGWKLNLFIDFGHGTYTIVYAIIQYK